VSTPKASRPEIPKGYGVPETEKGLLPWSHVTERIASPRNYWVATTRPDGRPHVVPVWGVWLDGTFFHGGGGDTRKARNLDANPHVAVHLESGDEVVIIEGTVEKLTEQTADPELLKRIDDAYEAKYGMRHGTPVWRLHPTVAFGWTEYPTTVTRWTFDAE
jgi:nitroimidazol reductase NimA-like FMN-containing flavoprotein (pyridoxamine 5'-phosphate oxidase superfamily)